MKAAVFVGVLCSSLSLTWACTPSVTTVSGSRAPQSFCSGQLIFEENFDNLDQGKWKHEMTMSGGGNWEFQWYVNDRSNSYTTGGNLHIKPTFTADIYGEAFLTSGRVVIPPEVCTQEWHYGCDRTGTPDNIINPIRSALVSTIDSFAYKFGTLEIRAKMPVGDWLWPALWMMPKYSVYGDWPRSGEIDLMEMRGNRNLYAQGGHVGNQQAASTMHFGPSQEHNGFMTTHWAKNQYPGWNENFHVYKVSWSPGQIQFLYDNEIIGTVDAGAGFWQRGGFASSGLQNPWAQGTNMAPFDQEFFIMLNLAVGGTNYFADEFENRGSYKPW